MTDRYAVFGNPISHSKSPLIHMSFARDTGQDIDYQWIEAPRDGFKASVEAFRAGGGKGFNVSTPFKLEAFALATRRMQRAELAGAANCLKFDGVETIAENFDGIGLVNDIQHNLGVQLAGRRVLLLGAGGAARGAILPLLEAKPAVLAVANRTPAKAEQLARQFAAYGHVEVAATGNLAPFDVVLNGTSASLKGELPTIVPPAFPPGGLAYELVYGKGLTPFLQHAKTHGATKLADGVGMLVEQAAEAFVWWRGVRPDTRPVIAQLTVPLT
jgi:shikimate dehydrogenase